MLGDAVLFHSERKGEQLRAKERAGVSGKEAQGGADNGHQLVASRPGIGQWWPRGGHARLSVGHAGRGAAFFRPRSEA